MEADTRSQIKCCAYILIKPCDYEVYIWVLRSCKIKLLKTQHQIQVFQTQCELEYIYIYKESPFLDAGVMVPVESTVCSTAALL